MERKNQIQLDGEVFLTKIHNLFPHFDNNKLVKLEDLTPHLEKVPDRYHCDCQLCLQGDQK